MPRKYSYYTEAEDATLEKLAGRVPCIELAGRMGRSFHSITNRCRRLGISRRYRDGWFCERDIEGILGIDHRVISKWLHDGTLKCVWKSERLGKKPKYAVILSRDLRKFIIDYASELVNKKVDLVTLIFLLSGKLN